MNHRKQIVEACEYPLRHSEVADFRFDKMIDNLEALVETRIKEAVAAALELKDAAEGLHVTHSTTDVHNHGGIAGQAFTRHCAWQCGVLDARLINGKVEGDLNRRLHEVALARYEAAVAAVEALS